MKSQWRKNNLLCALVVPWYEKNTKQRTVDRITLLAVHQRRGAIEYVRGLFVDTTLPDCPCQIRWFPQVFTTETIGRRSNLRGRRIIWESRNPPGATSVVQVGLTCTSVLRFPLLLHSITCSNRKRTGTNEGSTAEQYVKEPHRRRKVLNARTSLTAALSHIPYCPQSLFGGAHESESGSLPALIQASALVEAFIRFTHIIGWPFRTILQLLPVLKNSEQRYRRSLSMHKTRANYQNLFRFNVYFKTEPQNLVPYS